MNKTFTQPTIGEVAESSGISSTLIIAVLRQLGGGADARQSLEDIARHGIDGGFCGFVYYKDTVAFFKRHRKAIVALVAQQADEMGENPAEMVAGFNCLAGRELKRDSGYGPDREALRHNKAKLAEYMPSVCRCLYGGRLTDEDDVVANALAWFAGEEVAHAFERHCEQ